MFRSLYNTRSGPLRRLPNLTYKVKCQGNPLGEPGCCCPKGSEGHKSIGKNIRADVFESISTEYQSVSLLWKNSSRKWSDPIKSELCDNMTFRTALVEKFSLDIRKSAQFSKPNFLIKGLSSVNYI